MFNKLLVILTSLLLMVLFMNTSLFAKEKKKDMTDPYVTCGVIAVLIQEAALSLGPIYTPPVIKRTTRESNQMKMERKKKAKRVVKKTTIKRVTTKEQVVTKVEEFKPETFNYKSNSMYGQVNATVVTTEDGFKSKIRASTDVGMWTIETDDGTIIASQEMHPRKSSFRIEVDDEIYSPPYTILLNIEYMGIPNQLKVKLK